MALDEIAEIVGQRDAVDIATRANFACDLGRDILHPMFERVERDHPDGIVEATGNELADRGFEVAPLDTDFRCSVEAIDHHEQGLICAIGYGRTGHASFRHLRHSRLSFRYPITGTIGRRFLPKSPKS